MFIISIKRIRGMSLIWLCVVVALQGCASAPVGDWAFYEYEIHRPMCMDKNGSLEVPCSTVENPPIRTGRFFRLEQVKE